MQQRFDTILRVSQAIVDRQRHFLEHGEVAMRPLVLREIAGTLGLHESTISRVTTQKFMATPRGTFELKYFFGSHVATEAGGAASSTAIRALIKQLVAAEDAKAPLSDARISQILGEQGIVVARRTIAKYRESLQIPPVNQRKALVRRRDEPERQRPPPRSDSGDPQLRRREARARHAAFRPRDRRPRHPDGGQAARRRPR